MRFWTSCCVGVLGLVLAQPNCHANPYVEQAKRMSQVVFRTYQSATAANAAAFYANPGVMVTAGQSTKARTAARQKVLEEYISKVVPAMKPSTEVAHIPDEQPVANQTAPEKKWTRYYSEAKNRLRPHVKYEWSSNDKPGTSLLVLSKTHVNTLRDNFDVLMWYRNELDNQSSDEHHQGAHRFKRFLDHVVDGVLDGMPEAPRITMSSGAVSVPEWNLDERKLREQLVMAYRYLIAKYQVYPEYDEFAPADSAVLMTLLKLAYLMGAQLDFESFDRMDVNLERIGRGESWKRPIAAALEVLQAKANEDPMAEDDVSAGRYASEQPCVIVIPPPKPKQPPKPPPKKEDGQKIEIIIRPKDS